MLEYLENRRVAIHKKSARNNISNVVEQVSCPE